MSESTQGPGAFSEPPVDPSGFGPPVGSSIAERYALAQKAEGILAPVLTALLAFIVGGLVVLVTTGKNPIATYRAIFDGSGLNWLFPWVKGAERVTAAANFQQTLLITTGLILTGLAVAFAFRCGMFNIGGQGQYLVGSFFAVWIGSSFSGLTPIVHVVLVIAIAMLAGAAWAGIAGFLKATTGAHEVISTIMLNWIAIWVGQFLFGLGGPLQNSQEASIPISNDIVAGARLFVFWGPADFQGLSIGIFIALAALVVYWIILNRTTLGFGVKAVGFNPEAARYGGINVSRSYVLAMAISACSRGSPERSTSSAGSSTSRRATLRPRRSASSGSRLPCSGATRPSALVSRRSSSRHSSTARRRATSTPRSSSPSSRRT